MRTRVVANLAVFLTVFAVMSWWAVRNVVTLDAIEHPYELTVDLPATAGITSGSEVAYLGVHFGRVGDVDLIDGAVRAELKIDDGRRIPRGSIARVFRKSAIGEPYIDFQPPESFDPGTAGDADFYEAGDAVPIEDTTTPIEFAELLRTASDLISSIEPDRAAVLVHELALALDGRGEDLRTLTEAGDVLAATFAERTDVLDRLAVNGTRLTAVVAEHRQALGQSLSDLAAVGESLRNASGNTQVLLDRGQALLAELGDLVADTRPSVDCLLDDLVTVNDRAASPDQLAGLATHLDLAGAYGLLYNTRDLEADGPWVRVNLEVHPGSPAPQHDPPLDLPPVPAVPECPRVQGQAGASPVHSGASPVHSGASCASADCGGSLALATPRPAAPPAEQGGAIPGAVQADSTADFVPADVLADGRRPLTGPALAGGTAAAAAVAGTLAVRRSKGGRRAHH